jgi:hypothetical protein
MLFSAFRSLAFHLLLIASILGLCAATIFLIESADAADAFLTTTISNLKGPWVWTFGYGLALFIRRNGLRFANDVRNILEDNSSTALAISGIERSTLHRFAWKYTLPITGVGLLLTIAYGIPNPGVSYWMILFGILSIYYVAAYLLYAFVTMTSSFHELFNHMDEIAFRNGFSPLHIENMITYLSLTSTLGLFAIYAGFRGTLTGGFLFNDTTWRAFLTTPLVLFLPGTLFYNYYPRYVLRRIVQHKIFSLMLSLGQPESHDTKALLLSMREATIVNSQILPFVDYKSLPSYAIAILFILSLAYNNDPVIKGFVDSLIGRSP